MHWPAISPARLCRKQQFNTVNPCAEGNAFTTCKMCRCVQERAVGCAAGSRSARAAGMRSSTAPTKGTVTSLHSCSTAPTEGTVTSVDSWSTAPTQVKVTSLYGNCFTSQELCPYNELSLTQRNHCCQNAVIGSCIVTTSTMSLYWPFSQRNITVWHDQHGTYMSYVTCLQQSITRMLHVVPCTSISRWSTHGCKSTQQCEYAECMDQISLVRNMDCCNSTVLLCSWAMCHLVMASS